jgi:murein DD-endopeptidase MepM/ murein hydrolase activator NlpD
VKTDALAGHAAGAPPSDKADTKAHQAQTAARQLEAFFLRRLLAEARPQGGGMLDGGFAGDTFKQMLDEAIADKMTAAGGVGMAQLFAKQLAQGNGKTDETAAPQPPIAHAPASHDAALAALAPHGTPSIDPATIGAPRFVMPVAGRASSGYGLRTDPIHGGQVNHPGFDLAAATGTQVAAAAGGTVVHAGPAGTYGNLVTVRHENGFETRYAHLSEVGVKVGDVVQPGAQLGKVGTTGYSTGPHLHFEIRHDGQTIDPAPLLPLNRSDPRTMR